MAEENQQNAEQQFIIQKIYTKDISFESPHTPAVFGDQWKPEINVQLNATNKKIGENSFEVVLSITVTATQDSKTAFLIEVKQAGLFTIRGFEAENLGGMLGAYCPEILFPFAREVISDLCNKGGFPQVLLSPVNFNALYAQHKQQEAGAAQGTAH